mmetsp:Transcript_134344/g.429231  ORF Transcript_134344/g.429231 Transcript_134344/m.429231 type:complete len:292 (+) Transcript_134344:1144-2019(+)
MILHQHLETLVHDGHHLGDRQVIEVLAKGLLELRCDIVHAPQHEDRRERHHKHQHRIAALHGTQHRRHDTLGDQHHNDHLRVREGEGKLRNLLDVLRIDNAARQLLEDACQDGRRHRDNTCCHALHDETANPMHQHIAPISTIFEVLDAAGVEALEIDDFHFFVRHEGNVLQCCAIQHAHKPHQLVLKSHFFVSQGILGGAEGDEAACRIQPLAADLQQQGGTLPIPRVGLVGPEDNQHPKHEGETGPDLVDLLHVRGGINAQPTEEVEQAHGAEPAGQREDHRLRKHRTL